MQSNVKKMLLENDFCVLCTCSQDIPDASLMLYICDDSCTKIYMLTLKTTTKYVNIVNNTKVSVLVDTRDTIADKTVQVEALTIHGVASIVEDYDASRKIIHQMISKHDKLSNLASNDDVCVIEVTIKSIMFLENVDKVLHVDLPGQGGSAQG